MKNIVETAIEAGSFNTLVTAVKAAGLAETLATKKNITVFAPTDTAFAKLPVGTLESLLKDKAKLSKILMHHVVEGTVSSIDAASTKKAKTLANQEVKFHNKGLLNRCFAVDAACITSADIKATNGVIHVVDTVIMPKMS